MVRRAVFLDRDGVINANLKRDGKPVAPTRFEEFCILTGVEDAARALKARGFLLIIATNQPDVANGLTSRTEVDAMHDEIRRRMPIDDIMVCFHGDKDNCSCRKPKPGMLLEAGKRHGLDLPSSYFVGDRWRDVEAGRLAGCFTFFVDYGYAQDKVVIPNKIVRSLAEAANIILSHE